MRWKALGEYFGVLQLRKKIGEVTQSYGGVPNERKSSKLGRSKGGAVRESVIG